jgi:hypothetical protein
MPTDVRNAHVDEFRLPEIWGSAEALARADWMHELIKSEFAAGARAGDVVAR